MEARDEEILSLEFEHSLKDLKAARKGLALSYHPDRYNEIDDLLRHILNRRMQEINQAYERFTCIVNTGGQHNRVKGSF